LDESALNGTGQIGLTYKQLLNFLLRDLDQAAAFSEFNIFARMARRSRIARGISAFSVAGSIRPHIDNNIATRNRHWRGCPNRAEWYWRSTQFFLPDAKRRIDGSQVADKMVRPDDIIK
jgi:hypothetical protein